MKVRKITKIFAGQKMFSESLVNLFSSKPSGSGKEMEQKEGHGNQGQQSYHCFDGMSIKQVVHSNWFCLMQFA